MTEVELEGSEVENPQKDLLRIVAPLRLLFWGGLVCFVDLRLNGFDLVNDAVGMFLIAGGVFRLSAIRVARSYARAMGFVKTVVVLSTLQAFLGQVPIEKSKGVAFLWNAYGLAELAACFVFCLTMRLFCARAGLARAAESWWMTTWLFLIFHAVPLGVLNVVSGLAILRGDRVNLGLGPGAWLLGIALFLPLVHFFVSTSRMRRAAEDAVAEGA